MQSAQRDEDAAAAVAVGDLVGAARAGDVDLDDDQVRRVVHAQALDVLVGDLGVVVGRKVGGQGGEPERREERVLDGPEERAGGFGERGQDELHAHCV